MSIVLWLVAWWSATIGILCIQSHPASLTSLLGSALIAISLLAANKSGRLE